MAILPHIQGPEDVKRLSTAQLDELAGEIRQTIIDTVSRQGGHCPTYDAYADSLYRSENAQEVFAKYLRTAPPAR